MQHHQHLDRPGIFHAEIAMGSFSAATVLGAWSQGITSCLRLSEQSCAQWGEREEVTKIYSCGLTRCLNPWERIFPLRRGEFGTFCSVNISPAF